MFFRYLELAHSDKHVRSMKRLRSTHKRSWGKIFHNQLFLKRSGPSEFSNDNEKVEI